MITLTKNKQSIRSIALYLRLSKEDGDSEESESISNQRAIILDYINKNFDYKNCYEYIDDGISGATFNRPGFIKMMNELKENEIDLVITKNLARFGRNYIEAGEYIEKIFPSNNIRYIAILDGVDNFEDKVENEFAPLIGVFNEIFCKETSKSVKRSKRKRMEEGYYSCNIPPFGYKKDSENEGKLIVDDVAGLIVKRIFSMAVQGKNRRQIAETLNNEHVITPSEYLKIRGLEENTSTVWKPTMIKRILCNEVYLGDTLRGKTKSVSYKSDKKIFIKRENQIITHNTHEALVSEEDYKKIHANTQYGVPNIKKVSHRKIAKYSNFIYCECCNRKMAIRKQRTNNYSISCPNRLEVGNKCSNNKIYSYYELETMIIEQINREFNNYFKIVGKDLQLSKKQNNNTDSEIKKLNRELGLLRFKISKLYNDRLQGTIKEQEYKNVYDTLVSNRAKIEFNIKELENSKSVDIDETTAKIRQAKRILKNLKKDTLLIEEIGELINRIEINEKHLHIFFKFNKMPSKIVKM